MIALAFFALVSVNLASTTVLADNAAGDMVRSAANGEFLVSHYPPRALKVGEQGRVGFRITVEPDGSLGSCEVTQGSGSAALDRETCEVIVEFARFQPVRDGDGRAVRAVSDGYVDWKLPAGVKHAGAVAASANGASDLDKIVCKRTPRVGSIIIKVKQCMTLREWTRTADEAQEELKRLTRGGHVDGS